MSLKLASVLVCLPILAAHAANEIGFIEKFALADDRASVLAELIPASEDFYYFQALNFQNLGDAPALKNVLEQWAKRFPNSSRRRIIENRRALLSYEQSPQTTIDYLRDLLDPQLNHEQVARDRKPDLPEQLNQALIAREVFQAQALQNEDLSGVSEAGLEALVRERASLSIAQQRALLARIKRPDIDGLIDLLEATLRHKESRGFGEAPIHRDLLPAQLDELARRIPTLYESQPFVIARLRKLLPGADADAAYYPAEREAWLERSWAYVAKLAPAFNILKAQVLYQRLIHDRARGIYDRARFIEYLKLPRRAGYVNPRYLEQANRARFSFDLTENAAVELSQFPAIGYDDWLVRDYLLQLLRDENSWDSWTTWLRDTYVKPIFAEAKITAGIGDPEQWASLLAPADFQRLKDRVDVDFAPTNPQFFAPGDAVSLSVTVKNTPKLIVKLYELNALSYFLVEKRQLNTDINLDGLVANRETTYDLAAEPAMRSPFRRLPRTVDFPELKGRRGAWIVEFIGGGRSSRALIRKGQWQIVQQTGPAGDMLTVVDEAANPVKDAVVWVDGRRLGADEKAGVIVVPFSKEPGTKPVIVSDAAGTFATLTQFEQHAESYHLAAQIHIEREQLLARHEATVIVQPTLRLADTPVALGLLQDVRLTITTTTLDGIMTSREFPGLKLEQASAFTQVFQVPPRAATVSVHLDAKVDSLARAGAKEALHAEEQFSLNGIDATAALYDAHLVRLPSGFTIDVLGRNGEPIRDQVVSLSVSRNHFSEPVRLNLSTDDRGRVTLGALAGVEQIEASLVNARTRRWTLADAGSVHGNVQHLRAGESARIPWTATATKLSRADVSLLERRGETFVTDRFEALSLADGFLVAKGLPPGDYSLFLPQNDEELTLRVTAGTPVRNWLVSPSRHLELTANSPVQIESAKVDAGTLVVQIRNANPLTRVYVAASHFIPEAQRLAALGGLPAFSPQLIEAARRPNLFTAGRAIGDEYRYILERRYAKTYPGNLLTRPGLLLNPWEVRTTDLANMETAGADALTRSAGDRESRRKMETAAESAIPALAPMGENTSSDLEFLANSAPVFVNLKPDPAGIVSIDRKTLGDRHFVQIVATDAVTAAWKNVALPEVPPALQDLRLARPLDASQAFAEARTITPLARGESITLDDVLTAELETYDTLGAAYALLRTLNPDPNLATFSFIIEWPKLKPEEKRAKYSEYACHELNFFLSRKDPEFFTAVVQPYLRNKKDRTFMDDYLISADLHAYLQPWQNERLNAVERCLLAQRVAEDKANNARRIRELWELTPPQPEREDRLFETALRGRALSAEDGGELREQMDAAKDQAAASFAAAPASPPAPMAAAKSLHARALPGGLAAMAAPAPMNSINMPSEIAKSGNVIALNLDGTEAQRMRAEVRAYFRELGPTKEWAENNYYKRPIAEQKSELVKVNAFWRDYAAWDGKSAFLSEHLPEASGSFTEALLALAVTDLPFEAAKHATKAERGSFTLTAGSPLLAVRRQIQRAGVAADEGAAGPPLLVSENFFRADDRYTEEGNERADKYVTSEFLPGVLYGANLVVTNPRSTAQKLELLVQIPEGAVPAQKSKATESRRLRLAPFSTQTLEYFFYFPAAGEKEFAHYPVHVSRSGQAAGAATATKFRVVNKLSTEDTSSWEYVSQYANEEQVFVFLEKHNLARVDLEKIAWRARGSAAFFRKVVTFLQQHHVWNEPIFRYGLLHNDAAAIRQWLLHRDDFVQQCGPALDAALLRIDPIERRSYEHLEYSPLVNQRAHRIGWENKIANPVLRAQYQRLLEIIAHQPKLEAADQLSVVYYLFLQDRIEEALARLQRIPADTVRTRVQYDYLRCYAALYEEQLAIARSIAKEYADYPVDRWREVFGEVIAQLDEIEGRKPTRTGSGVPDAIARQSELAASEPAFDFKVENRTITLTWKNLGEVTVNYYLMDPEFLFSASPFVTQDSSRFSIIKPTRSDRQLLPADRNGLELPLPDAFAKSNVLVEILGAGQRKAQPYHANTLKLVLAENYGRLDLRDTLADHAVAKAYVKVYARLRSGQIRFFKDGYTDLRGRFDYASLNSSASAAPPRPLPARTAANGLDYPMLAPAELNDVERLSLLILSDEHGAVVREVSPPSQ